MKSVSIWAHEHKWAARISIAVSWILLGVVAVFLGSIVLSNDGFYSILFFYTALAASLIAMCLYPLKKDKKRIRHFYLQQKSCDFILATSTFLFMIVGCVPSNQFTASFQPFQSSLAIQPATNSASIVVKPAKAHRLSTKSAIKSIKENIREIKKSFKDLSKGWQIVLVVLSILVAAGLLLLLAAASCSISCSGSGALAIVVMVAGSALIIFALVRVIRRITKGKRIRKERAPVSASV